MKKILTALLLFNILWLQTCIFTSGKANAAHIYPEKYYQNKWCGKWGGKAEYLLPDRTRVDCITKSYAVEFDFAPKWAEAVGQSLYYSKITGKQAAIVLILEKESDFKYFERAKLLAKDNNIQLWYMKSPEYGGYSPVPKTSDTNIALNIKDFEKMFRIVYRLVNSLL